MFYNCDVDKQYTLSLSLSIYILFESAVINYMFELYSNNEDLSLTLFALLYFISLQCKTSSRQCLNVLSFEVSPPFLRPYIIVEKGMPKVKTRHIEELTQSVR